MKRIASLATGLCLMFGWAALAPAEVGRAPAGRDSVPVQPAPTTVGRASVPVQAAPTTVGRASVPVQPAPIVVGRGSVPVQTSPLTGAPRGKQPVRAAAPRSPAPVGHAETATSGGCETPGDGDADGRVSISDYRLMAACFTHPVGPIDPPAYDEGCACFDFDEDGDVDLADFASFQLVFERFSQVAIELVSRSSPGPLDQRRGLPDNRDAFAVGESIFVEVWAQTIRLNGLASVYVDVTFDPGVLEGLNITHTDLFDLFPRGELDDEVGLVREVGGSHLGVQGCSDPVGRMPDWARVAIIEFRAESAGVTNVISDGTGSPFTISICGSFNRPETDYGARPVEIVEP